MGASAGVLGGVVYQLPWYLGMEGGCRHLVVGARLQQPVVSRRFGCFLYNGGVDDHPTKVGPVCWGDAHVWEVEAEEGSEKVADFPAESGGEGFGGLEGHPVA